MNQAPTILLIGTVDTKSDEIGFAEHDRHSPGILRRMYGR